MSLHMTSSQIKIERNKEEKIIYAIDHDNREEEITINLNETVYDLKRKIEKKFNLHTDILKDQKIRKKGAKDRTFKDLGDNVWECLSRPQKRLHVGTIIKFSDELRQQSTIFTIHKGCNIVT